MVAFVSLLVFFGELFTGEESVMWLITLLVNLEGFNGESFNKQTEETISIAVDELEEVVPQFSFSGRHLVDEADNDWETVSFCFLMVL